MNTFKTSKQIAIWSFSIGTLLLLLHLIFKTSLSIIRLGYAYVVFATILNGLILISLSITLFIAKDRKETLKSMGVITLNIPITLVYFQIVIDTL